MATKTTTIKQLHSDLRGNYKSQWNEDTDALCRRKLPELYDEVGEERLCKAVAAMIDANEFFEFSHLRQHIPASYQQYARCDRCREYDGFVYVLIQGEKQPRARKCDHKTPEPSVRVWIGPAHDRKQVWATSCDYIEENVGHERA